MCIQTTVLYTCAITQPNAIYTFHVTIKYVPETDIPSKWDISTIYANPQKTYIEDVYTCATYEVTASNHVTMGTVHIFDIYHRTNMAATLHMYIPLQQLL